MGLRIYDETIEDDISIKDDDLEEFFKKNLQLDSENDEF